LDHARHPEAVIAVEVGDAHVGDVAGRRAGEGHLALGALAGVEQEPFVVPTQQIAVVIPDTGRRLAGGSEYDKFPERHNLGA
jgi:hypothetical protein